MAPPAKTPPRTHRNVLVATAFGAVALVCVVARTRSPSGATGRDARPRDAAVEPVGGCRFATGDVRAWHLTQRMNQDGRELTRLSASLTLRATAVDPRTLTTHHAATLGGVETADDALRAQLVAMRGVTFAVRMGRDCTFEAMGFPAGTDPLGARAVRGLLRPFEVSMPTGEAPPRWLTQQHEGPADVSVRYTRVEGGYERQRLRYLAAATRVMTPEIVSSTARFAMADDGRWLSRMDGVEETRLRVGEARTATLLRVSIELRATSGEWQGDAPPASALDAMDFTERAPPEATAEAARDPALDLALEPAVDHLGELFDRRRNGAAEEAVNYFVAYLRAHPERAADLLRWMRQRSYPERLGAVSFFAMSRVNDPRVVEALARTAEDDGFAQGERVRASIALADNEGASVESVERLGRVARRPHATADDELVSDGALNAIGAIRSRSTGAVAEAATRELRDALDGARTPAAQSDALDAIGNARDTSFLPAAREAMGSASTQVRESAAGALAGMNDPSAEATLRERLRVETDPTVCVAIIRAILTRTDRRPGVESVAVAAWRLPREPSAAVRLALVDLIGAAAAWSGEARAALAEWFSRETDARVQVAIGRYLPAEALGGARDR